MNDKGSGGCGCGGAEGWDFASVLLFPFFCRNGSTVGIPLSLSFRWSVWPLILACTPRTSQGRSWEADTSGGERTDGRIKQHWRSAPVMVLVSLGRIRMHETRTDRGFRTVRTPASKHAAVDNCPFKRSPLSYLDEMSLSHLCNYERVLCWKFPARRSASGSARTSPSSEKKIFYHRI